jgi:hypothetical protein
MIRKKQAWYPLRGRAVRLLREAELLCSRVDARQMELGIAGSGIDHRGREAKQRAYDLVLRFHHLGGVDRAREIETALGESIRLLEADLRQIGEPQSRMPRDVLGELDALRRSVNRTCRKLRTANVPAAAWRSHERVLREERLFDIERAPASKERLLAAVRDARELFDAAASGKLREIRREVVR